MNNKFNEASILNYRGFLIGNNNMKKKIKNKKPLNINAINFDLFHNGLYKMKIIKNKKKEIKKFNFKKEISYYLNTYLLNV